MKEGLIGKKMGFTPLEKSRSKRLKPRPRAERSQTGFSTLEMLIAFAVITLTITAIILVSFGNQSIAVDTEVANEALYITERELEEARADAIEDFYSVNSLYTPAAVGEIFDKEILVTNISECVKRIKSTVSWQDGVRNLSTDLVTLVTSLDASVALGNDCDTEETSEWDSPGTYDSVDLSPSGNKGTDVDVIKRDGDIYAVLTSEATAIAKDDFWIIEAIDPENISILSSINVGEHLNAVDSYGDYAFVGSASTTAQFQVIDISNFGSPVVVVVKELDGVDPAGSYPEAVSIYYYDGYVYVGTKETGGPEFHIFDVSNPSNPTHEGSIELSHNVNKIVVLGDYAYLATSDNTGELMVIDISNPASLEHPDITGMKFDATGNYDGTALSVSENVVYLGRKRSMSAHDFYIIDSSDLDNMTSLGSQDIGLNPNTMIVDLVVRGELAFLVTSDSTAGFQVWNVADTSDIHLASSCSSYNYSEQASGFDFVDNIGFVANKANDALRVIYDTPDQCTP